MSDKLLSVITVVRNDPTGLGRTLSNLREEFDRTSVEFVVIDGSDAPTSVTEDPRIVYAHSKDEGIAHAFNKGVLRASGRFLLFINAGDALVKGGGAFVMTTLQGDQNADCHWFSVWRVFQKDGRERREKFSPRLRWLPYAMSAPHQGMVMSRMAYARTGLFPLQRYAMDHDVAMRLLLSCPAMRIVVHSEVIADYPYGGHSTQGGWRPFLYNIRNVMRFRLRLLPMAILANGYLMMKSALR